MSDAAGLDSGGEDTDLALTIRNLYADLDTGQLVGVEAKIRSLTPPPRGASSQLAHQTCRAPFCNAPIRQMDHIVAWSQGGATSLDNGNGTCSGDSQKEESGESVRVIHDEKDGTRRTVEWTTRYGQKARRGGINFDPVGTYRRQRRRQLAKVRHRRPLPVPHRRLTHLCPSCSPRSHRRPMASHCRCAETPPVVEGLLETSWSRPSHRPTAPERPEEPALDEEPSAGWSTIYRAFDRLQLRITDLPIIRPLLPATASSSCWTTWPGAVPRDRRSHLDRRTPPGWH